MSRLEKKKSTFNLHKQFLFLFDQIKLEYNASYSSVSEIISCMIVSSTEPKTYRRDFQLAK